MDLLSRSRVVFDFETDRLETHHPDLEIVGLGFSWEVGSAVYADFPDDKQEQAETLELFRPFFESENVGKCGQNLKYDCRVLQRFGIRPENIEHDSILAHYCLFNDRLTHNLDDMCLHHLGHVKIRTKSVIPKKTKNNPEPSMKQADPEVVGLYCCEDCDYTLRLIEKYTRLLEEDTNARFLYHEFEMPLLPVLIDMECDGVRIDIDHLEDLRTSITDRIQECKDEMKEELGEEISITNTRAIEKALYDDLEVHKIKRQRVKRTASGRRSTDAATLETFKWHPYVANLLMVKKLNKVLNTYVDAIPPKVELGTNILRANFNQTVTATGRLSSNGPNLQNIPQREETGRKVRQAFISRFDGGQILAADYSQCELRILAHMTGEPAMVEAFTEGQDIHSKVAAIINDVTIDEVTAYQRTPAKTANFLIIYGGRAFKLASTLGIPIEQAEKIIADYLGKLTQVNRFIDESAELVRYYGYTETLWGRRRYIPKIFSRDVKEQMAAEREAMNHRIQGTNADLIKLAMIQVHTMLRQRKLQSKLVMQIHDEIVLDVHPDDIPFLKDDVLQIMENIHKFDVPMVADGRYADNWAEAH